MSEKHEKDCCCVECVAERLIEQISINVSSVTCECPACEIACSEAREYQAALRESLKALRQIRPLTESDSTLAATTQATLMGIISVTSCAMSSLKHLMDAAHDGYETVSGEVAFETLKKVAETLKNKGFAAGVGYIDPEGVITPMDIDSDPSTWN